MAVVLNKLWIEDLEEGSAINLHPSVALDLFVLGADSEYEIGLHALFAKHGVPSARAVQARIGDSRGAKPSCERLAEQNTSDDPRKRNVRVRLPPAWIEERENVRKAALHEERWELEPKVGESCGDPCRLDESAGCRSHDVLGRIRECFNCIAQPILSGKSNV
jgi:hypothetical protein